MPKALLDPEHVPFDIRHGISAPFCRGIKRQAGPGEIPLDQFYTIQNARIVGNQIISRGGRTKVNTSAVLTGSIFGIWDDGNGVV